jgi:hypothetical protein
MKSKKIRYGKKDVIAADEFEPKNVKERITTMIDEDIIDWLKGEAAKNKTGYQTLLNSILREAKDGKAEDDFSKRVWEVIAVRWASLKQELESELEEKVEEAVKKHA